MESGAFGCFDSFYSENINIVHHNLIDKFENWLFYKWQSQTMSPLFFNNVTMDRSISFSTLIRVKF